MERGITSFIKVGFLVGIFFLGGLWVFRLINSSEKLEFWVHFKTALFPGVGDLELFLTLQMSGLPQFMAFFGDFTTI
jgi:hypothetical protein